MNALLSVIGVILLGGVAMYLIKELVEAIINLKVINREKQMPDLAKQRNGIVYNKKTHKLEADQSMILPY